MVVPGNLASAARLAGAAGSVSHDGEFFHAAKIWATRRPKPYVEGYHLLDTRLRVIARPSHSHSHHRYSAIVQI